MAGKLLERKYETIRRHPQQNNACAERKSILPSGIVLDIAAKIGKKSIVRI